MMIWMIYVSNLGSGQVVYAFPKWTNLDEYIAAGHRHNYTVFVVRPKQ